MASNNVSLTGLGASSFHITEARQQDDHEHGPRSTGTAQSSFTQRRMDSMARLMHSHGSDISTRKKPIVTAVAFGEKDDRVVLEVAHNKTNDQVANADAQRLRNLAGFLKGSKTPEQFRANIHENAEHGMSNYAGGKYATAEERLMADARKLKQTYEGGDDQKSGGVALRERLHAVIDSVNDTDPLPLEDKTIPVQVNKNDPRTIHAEAALVKHQSEGAIGVSKLSCGDCDDYAADHGRSGDLRGTHGMYFPKWVNPDDHGETTAGATFVPTANQYASDSESDVEHH